MIYSKLYREFCERFGYWPWVIMVLAFAGLVLFRGYQRSSIAETERQLAIEACVEAGALPDCREWIESHHQACFDYNFTGGDIYGSSGLDRDGYRECLKIGFESYIAEIRARERANFALQKELLD